MLNSVYGIVLDNISDHLPIFFVHGNVQDHRSVTHFKKRVRQMNDPNFDSFKTKIRCVDWRAVDNSDTSAFYDCFHNILACIYEESYPVQENTYKYLKINTNHDYNCLLKFG